MKTEFRSMGILSGILIVTIFLFTIMPNSLNAAERKTFKLRVGAGQPYSKACNWILSLEDFFCREVEKRVLERTKKYKVKCKGLYGGSVAKLGEVLESTGAGMLDIGMITVTFELGKLEPTNFTQWIPFTPKDLDKVLRATTKTVNHFPEFEKLFARENLRQLGAGYWNQNSYHLITDFPVKTMEDLKGKKIGHGGNMLPWLKALGATSVQSVYPEVYTSIDTGVLNGYCMPACVVTGFKIYEVAKHFTKVDFGGNIAGYLTINLNTWKRLPKEVQDILIEVGSEWSWDVYKRVLVDTDKAFKVMKNAGVEIYNLPQEEKLRWAKTLNDARVAAKAIADCKSHGYPADEIANFYVKTLIEDEKAGFLVPPKLEMN